MRSHSASAPPRPCNPSSPTQITPNPPSTRSPKRSSCAPPVWPSSRSSRPASSGPARPAAASSSPACRMGAGAPRAVSGPPGWGSDSRSGRTLANCRCLPLHYHTVIPGRLIGFWVGVDSVVVLNSADAVRAFAQTGNLTIGGNLSAAAGPIGTGGAVNASLLHPAPLFTYSYAHLVRTQLQVT